MRELLNELADRVEPAHSAVLVVDMQNDFCAEGGYIDRRFGCDAAANRALAEANTALAAAARDAGAMVIWVLAIYDPKYLSAPMLTKLAARDGTGGEVRCAEGSWGAEFYRVAPATGETVIKKHRYSAFCGTELDDVLREHGIRTVVVTGVATNVCVESTLRDGFNRGYYIVVPRDCVASSNQELHDATLKNVDFLLGEVVDSSQLVDLWRGAADRLKKAG